jgi:hypothetical protein
MWSTEKRVILMFRECERSISKNLPLLYNCFVVNTILEVIVALASDKAILSYSGKFERYGPRMK